MPELDLFLLPLRSGRLLRRTGVFDGLTLRSNESTAFIQRKYHARDYTHIRIVTTMRNEGVRIMLVSSRTRI